MKFSEMPYKRPDPEEIIKKTQDLTERFKNAKTFEEAHEVFLEYEK